jgi:TonB family protein
MTMTRNSYRFLAAGLLLSSVLLHAPVGAQEKQDRNRSTITYKTGVKVSNEVTLPDGRLIYKGVKQMPVFQGDMQEFLVSNLRYPEEARKKKIQGRSIVQFIVSADGKVSDAEIVRSTGNELLDNESLRVVNLMQDWTPGMHEGQPVAVYFYLPVSYSLD